MLRTAFITALVGGVLSILAPSASAQPATGRTTAAPQEYRVKQILGTKVNIQSDINIGTVEDIVFADDGVVEYLVVNNQGKLVSVPWEAAKFNFGQRTATVNIAPDVYKTMPTYTAEQYPSFYAPAYRVQTYKYYGLTPREIRRIELKR